ncbi:MAG: hypothetical protein CMO55_21745 [Verrucomicrobiales bacterium]|nr:hypothetical protein [Verrucomicrobiales bacterium]
MFRLSILSVVLASLCVCTNGAEYQGNVGKLKATFQIEWDGEKVSGSYSYNNRPGTVYTLQGNNPEPGVINLSEYTGNELTARCQLTKRVTDDEIIWEGRMHNTDGREFLMSFSRIRKAEMPFTPTEEGPIEFNYNENIHRDVVSAAIGARDSLEAHLYGNLYYGWHVPGGIVSEDASIDTVKEYVIHGDSTWAAIRFAGSKVELQFETPDGNRRTLTGTNPDDGVLELNDGSGHPWTFWKELHERAIIWWGMPRGGGESLLVYRPRPELFPYAQKEMPLVAPEAFLWEYNEWGAEFHRARFAYAYDEEVPATVDKIMESDGRVTAIHFGLKDGTELVLSLSPSRPRNRVPLAEGFPATIHGKDEEILSVVAMLTPLSWRQNGTNTLEYLMVSTDLADFQYDDLWNPTLAPGRLETLTKIPVQPDFAIPAHDVAVKWQTKEDKITWGIGDRGAGMLELESISFENIEDTSLRSDFTASEWYPLEKQVDFPNNQLRISNLNLTTGFNQVLEIP